MAFADLFPSPVHLATSATPALGVVPIAQPGGALPTGVRLVPRNLSGGDITAVSVAASYDGTTYGAERTITASLPLAAGDDMTIEVNDTPALAYRLTVTAASSGAADVVLLDEPTIRRAIRALRVDGADEAVDGTTGAVAPSFAGTAPTVAATNTATGTGFATAGQVVTTTETTFTAAANLYADCWLITATQPPCLIVSRPAATAEALALTVIGAAPTTAAEAFRILRAPTPAGAVASHTHTVSALA